MNRQLLRQLKRALGVGSPEQARALFERLAALADRAHDADAAAAMRALPSLLEHVGVSYDLYDRDIALASRSLAISSDELLTANARVHADNRLQQNTIVHLREALRGLAASAGLPPTEGDDAGLESLSQRLASLVAAHDAAQRALQASEAKFRALTAMSSDWYWEQDAQARFIATTGNREDRGGLTPAQHVGRARWELPHTEPVSGDWREHRATLEARQPFHDLMLRRTGADGQVHFVEVNGEPVFDDAGAFTGYRGTARDVTARIEVERALRTAKQAADDANAAKSMFVAHVSHELRTPLNGLLGMAELAQDDAVTPAQRERARLMLASGRQLLTIVNDILDFSKIEAGHLALVDAPFELRAAVDEVLALYRAPADAKALPLRLDWQAPGRLWLDGDAVRLKQVLGNLLSNAIKFTAQGEVSLVVQCAEAKPGQHAALAFDVYDSGEGIPAKALDRLFQPFTQADAGTTKRHGGTGLGLAICRRIVEHMGGRIELASRLGTGTEVHVMLALPCLPAPAEAPSPQAAPLPHWRERRVLLVEDNPINLAVASMHLERLGIAPNTAANGAEGLAALEENRFDLVLMDCHMPQMDGFEAVARWRERESTRGSRQATPIVAMTADSMAGDRERSMAVGFDDHLGKPFTRSQLVQVLSRWLGPADAA